MQLLEGIKGLFSNDIGIDLGTANTLVFLKDKGIVLREPSVVAIQAGTKNVLAVGSEARAMLGRTPGNIEAIRPMKDGVIADYYITRAMLQYFISKAIGQFNFFKPDVVISAPAGISTTERRAVINAATEAGAKNVFIV